MFEILVTVLFIWLFVKTLGLTFRVTWSLAKGIALCLFGLAVPVLAVCLLAAGGVLLLIPVALVAAAFGILKVCT